MTLSQLETLTEDELAIALYIVNKIDPLSPPVELKARGLTWLKRDVLIKKLLDAFPKLKPEAHNIFVSLMEKLGVKVEIKQDPPPQQSPQEQVTLGSVQ